MAKYRVMTNEVPDEEIVSAEACEILDVHRSTLIREIQRGHLTYSRKLPGAKGHYLFRRSEVERLARERAEDAAVQGQLALGASA